MLTYTYLYTQAYIPQAYKRTFAVLCLFRMYPDFTSDFPLTASLTASYLTFLSGKAKLLAEVENMASMAHCSSGTGNHLHWLGPTP